MQRGGWMCVSPAEVARNCDVLLLVGVGDVDHLFAGRSPPPAIHIGTKEAATSLATLRAMILGTKSTQLAKRAQKHKSAVQQLKAAKYGVAVWQSGALDEPAVEMLMGLVRDLNQSSRFSALPLAAAGNANGANFISSWLTGFPVRTSFGQGQPEHDPWAFSAERMVVSGEADAALWLSAFDTALPEWVNRVPAVALVARGSRPNIWPNVLVEVGTPGIDHDGVFFRPETGALGFQASSQQTDVPRADQVLADILAALPSEVLAA
jgi:formylmethanofuran dehydrogenase subunit B